VPEVVLAEHKSTEQLVALASHCVQQEKNVFMTRVSQAKADALYESLPGQVFVHAGSRTVYVGHEPLALNAEQEPRIAIVAAGTSDVPVVAEIEQTLLYLGEGSRRYVDVGVAGLWRLTELAEELSANSVIIAVAGMEGALFSVLAGLVPAPVIAVPVSVGYGVASGGNVALQSALSSCAPGIAVVNIDNGFGAAALAVKMLGILQAHG
jgi:NCAIR mutase (PurE)-related protein